MSEDRRPNKYAGRCGRCGDEVGAGAGLLVFASGVDADAAGWVVMHPRCAGEPEEPAPTFEQMATRTAEGERWLAFCWLEGIRPRPPGLADERLADMLEGADVGAMRERHGWERRRTLARYGH